MNLGKKIPFYIEFSFREEKIETKHRSVCLKTKLDDQCGKIMKFKLCFKEKIKNKKIKNKTMYRSG